MIRIKGRTAIVTGASSGIGRAIALRLARRGVRVALVARSAARLEEVADAARRGGTVALVVPCDVCDRESVRLAHDRVVAAFGSVDILVNAAGFGIWKPFLDIREEEHTGMMDTIYWGAFHWIRAALPGMRERGGASVLRPPR
jgi:NAD(P)-dependent dehydrogenase (short-subunit alcohol dehydrogenase family)